MIVMRSTIVERGKMKPEEIAAGAAFFGLVYGPGSQCWDFWARIQGGFLRLNVQGVGLSFVPDSDVEFVQVKRVHAVTIIISDKHTQPTTGVGDDA